MQNKTKELITSSGVFVALVVIYALGFTYPLIHQILGAFCVVVVGFFPFYIVIVEVGKEEDDENNFGSK